MKELILSDDDSIASKTEVEIQGLRFAVYIQSITYSSSSDNVVNARFKYMPTFSLEFPLNYLIVDGESWNHSSI